MTDSHHKESVSIPSGLLEYTCFLSILALLITTISTSQIQGIPALVPFFSYPHFLQAITILMLLTLVFFFPFNFSARIFFRLSNGSTHFYFPRLLIVFVSLIGFFLLFLIDDSFARLAFGKYSLEASTFEPSIISEIKDIRFSAFDGNIFGMITNNNSVSGPDIPSGFVLRQWIITIFTIFILSQKRYMISANIKRVLLAIFSIVFIYISLSRLFLLSHSPLAIGAAMPLGTIISFLVIFLLFLLSHISIRKDEMKLYASFCMGTFIMFTIISYNPMFWILTGLVYLTLLSFVYKKTMLVKS